jgi:hypothetical protein
MNWFRYFLFRKISRIYLREIYQQNIIEQYSMSQNMSDLESKEKSEIEKLLESE